MDETVSRVEHIRDKLDVGLLPLALPEKIWGGCGHGGSCSACDRPIHRTQLEYSFLTQDSDKPLRFHFACLGLWLAALRRRGIEVRRVAILNVTEADVPSSGQEA
jgi:hypothetical protein